MNLKSFFSTFAFVVFVFCIFTFVSDAFSNEQYVQIFGEQHRLLEYDGTTRSYEITFSVRNNTEQYIVHFCYIPHLYNQYGEIYQVDNPGNSIQFCTSEEISPKGRREFTVQISNYGGIATRVSVESVFFMLSD